MGGSGAGALSHVYLQYPPFRCNIPGSSKMMYDDGSRLLLVPSPDKMFSWPVARHTQSNSPNVTVVDNGPVLGARFSLDLTILAIQSSDCEVSFYNRESGAKFKQLCRSRRDRILGFFWTDCPTCDIVFVTTGGLELFSLAPRLDAVKLVDVRPLQVSWYLYTHESRLLLVASGMHCRTFQCYQFSAAGIIRLPKFDAGLKKLEANRKVTIGPEDVHIATMYGRLYCLQVDRLSMELNIYRFYRDAVVPQGTIPVYSETVAFSVVDGVLLVHQLASEVVLLYAIYADLKGPISAPLPLLIRGDSCFTMAGCESSTESNDILDNEDMRTLASSESNIYGENWVFANPDIILDQDHGIMWRIHLDLEAIATSSSDLPSLLEFLQRRRLDAAVAKELSMMVLCNMIMEKRPLLLISEAMDVISMAYSQFLRTRATLVIAKQPSARPQVPARHDQRKKAGKEDEKDVPVSDCNTNIIPECSDQAQKQSENVGSSKRMSNATVEQCKIAHEVVGIVEETDESAAHNKSENSTGSPLSISHNISLAVTAVSPEEMYHHVFAVIDNETDVDSSTLIAAIIQYLRSAASEKLNFPVDLQLLLIKLLTKEKRYPELMHLVRTKVLEPSKEVAKEMLQVGKSYQPVFMLGLNMLRQLSLHGDYLSEILQQGRLLEALRYARQNRVEAIPPSTFLELAAASQDIQKLASVMRFCLDFVPSFETTSEYQTYSAVLSQQKIVPA
ncbi:hypothetical protein KP509_37G021500 [Ceratopteris richardii]|nr:hypothetical protein KP509_37G021500 [Ceratopteris richardii]